MKEEFDLMPKDETIEPSAHDADLDDDLSIDEDPTPGERITARQKIILVSIGAAVLFILLGLIVGLLLFSGRSNDDAQILKNVYAAGVDLSGMTVEEAINALHAATDQSIAREPMVVHIYDGTLVLNPINTKASLDVEALAQAAYNYGRTGNQAENQQIRKNAHRRSYTIPLLPYLNLDLTVIRNTVDSYCESVASEYAEPVITMVGARPVYGSQSPQHQTMKITLGTPLRRLDADDLYDQILDAYSMNELLLEYEIPEPLWPTQVNAQELFDQYCTPAQDATLDTETYQITPEVYGYGFQVNALQKILDEADPGETVEITLSFLEPAILAQDLNDDLFQKTLSKCSSTSLVDDNARDHNLQLSCNAINGHIIKPGETFSFMATLGAVSAKTGYSTAPICSINDSTMGGGISQTATALYYCALHADLDVVEHHNHKYATDFMELGMDAYVDGSTNDLKFRNNTSAPIRIEASVSRHTVNVSFLSANTLNYTISIRSQVTATQLPVTTYQMLLPNNQQGYRDGDVITKGIEGYTVSVFKDKLDLSSGNVLSTNSVSTGDYKKRDEVIARIGMFEPDDPTAPEETTPTQNTIFTP